ncbi:hypothetical protein [Burkholderia sp. THE68]|uniref:hypothetical protein n=1 Tax=Burkholderia sp. THE68 TaxID=758782 RepID=UPI00138A4EF8|nr:hypothetical protein [Burkholderia sp. THE68]
MSFAFPFLKKGQRDADAAVKFTDEHEIYQLLADREPGGSFLVSKNGFWHGGIHITENGAGSKLDLKQGIRCIADGHVIAYRVNRTYPVSQLGGVQAPYSTGFALVRHTMEFPKGTKLTFYSLYMHLLAYEEYEQDATTKKPTYWPTQYKVTEHAQDKPDPSRVGQLPEAGQQGLRVRSGPRGGHRGAHPLGILPQGACVSIGEQQKGWGKITDVHGAQLYAPKVGEVPPTSVVGGWIFLGNEHGGPVVQGFMPDDAFDRVTVTLSSSSSGSDANAQGIPVKAGDLIGHLGRFDSLSASPRSATRMVHIEVFCDESIKSFIEQGRSWVASHGAHPDDWKPLGLSSEPTLLRIAEGTKLYRNAEQEGAAPPVTGVAQRWSLAELARDPNRKHLEATADRSGRKSNWWRVGSADQRGQAIDGWVREENFAGGTVTRELAQKWVDFACLDGAHDPAHTIFATTRSWVDFASDANVPGAKSRAKLSPMMQSVHRTLFPQGDGAHAVDDLCLSYAGESGHYPWLMQAASRLIVKHESEWSNPQKWRQLYTEMEKGATNPQYEEEQKRIEKLVWWDEVKAKVPGFPGSDVFHIHPIGLVGNFARASSCTCGCCYLNKFKVTRMGNTYGPVYWGNRPLNSASVFEEMVASGEITLGEKRILIAMSENEGKLDSVQSYDSEILTSGAMQKTINPQGKGEFPTQVALFKSTNPSEYLELFEQCGWSVEGTGNGASMYYIHPSLTQNEKITGARLKALIRQDCNADKYNKEIESIPLAPIVNAINSKAFEKRQLMDFIDRLRDEVLPRNPSNYSHPISAYFLSDLGRAVALDQSVNRPAYVAPDVGAALDRFFARHPTISRDPSGWGGNHAQYETEIVEDYGNHRRMARINGVSVAPARYTHLRSQLN